MGDAFASSPASTSQEDWSISTAPSRQDRIASNLEVIFGNLEQIGTAYNDGGGDQALRAAVTALCNYGVREVSSLLMPEVKDLGGNFEFGGQVGARIGHRLMSGSAQAGLSYAGTACAALVSGSGSGGLDAERIQSGAMLALAEAGLEAARQSHLPFISNLQATVGMEDGDPYVTALLVQPLWEDKEVGRYVFNQSSVVRHSGDTIFNTGFAIRQLFYDDTLLLGGNIFFDHTLDQGHNRISIGVDAQTAYYGLSANRYIPISDWRSVSALYEERAMPGWDLRLEGRLPDLPTVDGFLRGYTWEAFGRENDDIYGLEAGLEWTPLPMLTFTGSLDDDNESAIEAKIAMTFNYRFGEQVQATEYDTSPQALSVASRVYQRVERENFVRVEQRRKLSTYLTVAQTIGVNSVADEEGTRSTSTGMSLTMPATLIVDPAVGSLVVLTFNDGAILTIGEGSTVSIDVDRVTLQSAGSVHYVSGSISRTVNVPGGTIALLGTDIDVLSNGSTTTTRVRDGVIRVTGNVGGQVQSSVGDMSSIVSGIVNPVASGSPTYTAHEAAITQQLDWVAEPLTGTKVAPYISQAPTLVTQNLSPGQVTTIGLHFNESVTVTGGTPQLNLTVGSNSRVAPLVSGSGSEDLIFGYTIQAGDSGETTIVVEEVDVNGATIASAGKDAVTNIIPTTLTLSAPINDVSAPSGYTAVFTTDPVIASNVTAAAFNILNAEVGSTYNYSITDGSTTVTGSGTVTAATQSVSGINLSTLANGTLTLSVTLTDPSSNVGSATTDTVVKDSTAPSGYSASFTTDPVTGANITATSFDILSAEVGTTYAYSISDGTSSVTGSGTVSSATQSVGPLDLTALSNGTLTLSVTLTDTAGNAGSAATDTVTKDGTAPGGYTTAFTTDPVNVANVTAASFNIVNAEVGSTYNYSITDGSATVTGSGTIATTTQAVGGLNLSTLANGTLTLSVTLTDSFGNVGSATTDTVTKDSTAPSGYTTVFTTDPVTAANVTAGSFNILTAEVGTTYNYSITDGSATVTGSGTVSSATQSVGPVNLSTLADGTLTLSVTLTDAAGNAGSATTDTVAKDSLPPSGYSVAFTTDPVNSANVTTAAFTLSSAEVGSTYSYTVTDSGSGSMTGSGTVTSATFAVPAIDVTALAQGTLTVSVTLTDTSGNAGSAATDTVTKDTVAPTIVSVTAPANATYGP